MCLVKNAQLYDAFDGLLYREIVCRKLVSNLFQRNQQSARVPVGNLIAFKNMDDITTQRKYK